MTTTSIGYISPLHIPHRIPQNRLLTTQPQQVAARPMHTKH